jgi:hypothetical protein
MSLQLTDQAGRTKAATWNGRPIFNYQYFTDDALLDEVPKPHFHPLRTLGGSVVTIGRPNDHPWHKGLAMTLTEVGETNFWGGGSYRKEARAYIWVHNHGRQRHLRWTEERCGETSGSIAHEIAWETGQGQLLLKEQRRLGFEVHAADAFWTLDFEMDIRNATSAPLGLGTYESNYGLTGSFYTGLFWRIPREFLDYLNLRDRITQGTMHCEAGHSTEEKIHGSPGHWVALTGSVDDVLEPVTLAMIDRSRPDMSAPRVFIRKQQVGVALPFLGQESRQLAPGESLKLCYRLVLADGHWSRDRMADYCRSVLEQK